MLDTYFLVYQFNILEDEEKRSVGAGLFSNLFYLSIKARIIFFFFQQKAVIFCTTLLSPEVGGFRKTTFYEKP